MSHDRILIKGNEAVAFGALDAGCRCYFGYPITPQNEIPETMSLDRKSTRLNSSHPSRSRMPSSA